MRGARNDNAGTNRPRRLENLRSTSAVLWNVDTLVCGEALQCFDACDRDSDRRPGLSSRSRWRDLSRARDLPIRMVMNRFWKRDKGVGKAAQRRPLAFPAVHGARLFLILFFTLATSQQVVAGEIFGVQVSAFQNADSALEIRAVLQNAGYAAYIALADSLYRVRVGPFSSRSEAMIQARRLWPFLVGRFTPGSFGKPWVVNETKLEGTRSPDRSADKNRIAPSTATAVLPESPGKEAEISAPTLVSAILRIARNFLGAPYRWGGAGPEAFDCSGFTSLVYKKAGVMLPRKAQDQFTVGRSVAREDLEPGDLVFFETYAPGPSHVGIYVGEGRFIHASSGAGRVIETSLTRPYYARRYLGARRVLSETERDDSLYVISRLPAKEKETRPEFPALP
ncbi:MAG: hypothetical protein D6679_04165 [Candidatus Hydrogenedentota bacterium]|nr:MAG: hypothetical protein D6679_04165 [Candidatus Hydrogenedentota bacterium]